MKRTARAILLCALAASLMAPIIIEKQWTPYSQERMMEIARERIGRAAVLAPGPDLSEAAAGIPWDPASPETWSPAVAEWADHAFDLYPPQSGHNALRRAVFEVFDVPAHLDFSEPLIETMDRMYHKRVDRAVEEIASLEGVPGARIWKLYNMSFVVMTKTKCLAFDLHPGRVVSPLSDKQIEALAKRCDALFISHRHEDHWDKRVLDAFARHDKPIVSPEGDFWGGHMIVVRDVRDEPLEVAGVKVWVYPGHQFTRCVCNLYVVEADGIKISHDGDMSQPHLWVMGIKRRHHINVALLNCWAIPSFNARGQDPDMIVIGHEYELGHDINGRRGVDETSRMLNSRFDRINLIWGESVDYK